MKQIEEIVDEIFSTYQRSGVEAEKYLQEARGLKQRFGSGFAIVYCWFYSVPQKWSQIESKIFELAKHTNYFDLETVSRISNKEIQRILRPIVFYNEISFQLKNFCKAVFNEFTSWDSFANELNGTSIFAIFEKLRKHKGIRLSFKNLAAMKIFVGMDDDLIILDRHVAKIFGLSESEQSKYRSRGDMFLHILKISESITEKLKGKGLNVTMAKWSLSLWFDGAKMSANDLLLKNVS